MNENPRVLIVDDDEQACKMLTLILERKGYRVQSAGSGREAIARASEACFDVSLLDIQLPDMSGSELLPQLQETHPDMTVIMVTGHASLETAVHALNEGATAYITKPVQVDQVLAEIRKGIERKRLLGEKRAAEQALVEERNLLRTLIDNLPDYIYAKDTEGRFTLANTAVARQVGVASPDELLGKTDHDSYPEDLAARYSADEQAILQSGQRMIAVKEPVVDHTGKKVWVSTTKVPLRNREGEIVGLVGLNRDITRLVCSEEALRESEERYRAFFQTSRDCVFITSKEGRWIEMNDIAPPLFGYPSREALQTVAIPDLYANPADRETHLRAIEQQGHMQDYAVDLRKRDGSLIHARITTVAVRDEGGTVTGFMGTIRDVTDQVRAERLLQALNRAALAMSQALTQEEAFLAAAKELHALGFVSTMWLADESGSVLSPALLGHEGVDVEAVERLVSMRHSEFVLDIEDTPVFRTVLREREAVFVRDTVSAVAELLPEHVREYVPQIVHALRMPCLIAAPMIVDGRVVGAFTVQSATLTADDVPAVTAFARQMSAEWRKVSLVQELRASLEELERTQDQLVQAQKMEAIGRLAGGVAHDFNNLLTAIEGYVDLASSGIASDDPADWPAAEALRSDLDAAAGAAARAANLTRQLLAFSRKQILQPQVLDLNGLIADFERMLRRIIGEDVELVTVLAPSLGRVEADPGQIEQVIMNLAVNARDAMPQGGRLILETANVTLDQDYARSHVEVEPGAYVMLAASDTGVGMNREVQARIFEPFFTTKEEGKGTGLGLSTVYGIVKQSGGHINVYSEPGVGTTFKIYLPRLQSAAALAEEAPAASAVPGGTETILLVEDEASVRALACRVLEGQGYTVLEAGHPQDALRLASEHEGRIDLLLTDMVMPGMRGQELAERLLPSHPEMAVLYISGYTDSGIVRHGRLEEGTSFLQKPFRPTVLARKVREVLDASRPGGRLERSQTSLEVRRLHAGDEPAEGQGPQTTSVPLNRESLAGLPVDLVAAMLEATMRADIDRLNEGIDRVAEHDAQLAAGLRTLADGYAYDALYDLFHAGKEKT